MTIDQGPGDGQTEAGPVSALPPTGGCPSERLKDPHSVCHRYAWTMIGDRDPRKGLATSHADVDRGA
jgi:hypothetical protein